MLGTPPVAGVVSALLNEKAFSATLSREPPGR